MSLISLVEYARIHQRDESVVRRKALKGGFKTARKIGRNWVIDSEEPYIDERVKSGNFVGWRNEKKEG